MLGYSDEIAQRLYERIDRDAFNGMLRSACGSLRIAISSGRT